MNVRKGVDLVGLWVGVSTVMCLLFVLLVEMGMEVVPFVWVFNQLYEMSEILGFVVVFLFWGLLIMLAVRWN